MLRWASTPSRPEGDTLRLDELLWDEWNEEHIRAHGIEPHEVEDAVFDPAGLVLRTRGARQPRYVVLGRTQVGRYLLVVLQPTGKRWYAITARDMTDAERRRYRRKGK